MFTKTKGTISSGRGDWEEYYSLKHDTQFKVRFGIERRNN